LTFNTLEEQLTALDNLKLAVEKIKLNNENFVKNLSNFLSTEYWFSSLSSKEFRSQYLGTIPPEQKKLVVLSLESVNGTESSLPVVRRKRQVSSTAGPECRNLPVYKNWVDEGIALFAN
jgi:hypothetical protein